MTSLSRLHLHRLAQWMLLLALAMPVTLCAADRAAAPTAPANEILRRAVEAEKSAAARDGYYLWTDRLQKPRGSATKLMVSTPVGILSRTVAINDRPLTADERKLDDDRINRLLDPGKMQEKAKHHKDDELHIERLLNALPDAFRCDYNNAQRDDRNLHLDCQPNPGFSPQNFESQILEGMKATILIDREDLRLAHIDGTLYKDVTFGWGILGRLNQGHIEIAQARVVGKHWGIQHLALSFDGRLVMVKPVHIDEIETSWDYRAVPAMTVAQALEFLRNVVYKPAH